MNAGVSVCIIHVMTLGSMIKRFRFVDKNAFYLNKLLTLIK